MGFLVVAFVSGVRRRPAQASTHGILPRAHVQQTTCAMVTVPSPSRFQRICTAVFVNVSNRSETAAHTQLHTLQHTLHAAHATCDICIWISGHKAVFAVVWHDGQNQKKFILIFLSLARRKYRIKTEEQECKLACRAKARPLESRYQTGARGPLPNHPALALTRWHAHDRLQNLSQT